MEVLKLSDFKELCFCDPSGSCLLLKKHNVPVKNLTFRGATVGQQLLTLKLKDPSKRQLIAIGNDIYI